MIYIDIPGGRVPALGFGTWRLDGAEAREAVAHAFQVGYRHIDTAQVYENEREVGDGLRTAGVDREAVFLTTKIWPDRLKRRAVLEAADESLRRLKVDYVDLLLVHWPNPEIELEETLDAFQEVQHRQKTRHIGVSNFPPALLREALAIAPGLITNQVEYHPYLGQSALLEIVREHGMFLTAYSPFVRGEVFGEPAVVEAAEAHGKSPAQVVLRWHVQQERVAAIPKAASAAHREANFDVFDFALSDAEMAAIHALAEEDRRISDPAWGPDWDAGA